MRNTTHAAATPSERQPSLWGSDRVARRCSCWWAAINYSNSNVQTMFSTPSSLDHYWCEGNENFPHSSFCKTCSLVCAESKLLRDPDVKDIADLLIIEWAVDAIIICNEPNLIFSKKCTKLILPIGECFLWIDRDYFKQGTSSVISTTFFALISYLECVWLSAADHSVHRKSETLKRSNGFWKHYDFVFQSTRIPRYLCSKAVNEWMRISS